MSESPAVRAPRRDGFRSWTLAVGLAGPVVLVALIAVLARQAWPAITRYGFGFLTGAGWDPVHEHFGALPFIYGTLATSTLALLIAIPVGVGAAVFLAEPGASRLRGVVGTGVELLAAIPSVVYGLWALFVLAPAVQIHVAAPISAAAGQIGLFRGPVSQLSLFTAGLVLAIMVLPTLAAVSRDVIRAVPRSMREASVALGATWSETMWRVILPAARQGILGAVVLALGRALGETIAVTMVIGNRPEINASLFKPAYTLASVIANEFAESTGSIYPAALVELGLVLVLVTVVVNLFALTLVRRTAVA